jgi:hypothetical protein
MISPPTASDGTIDTEPMQICRHSVLDLAAITPPGSDWRMEHVPPSVQRIYFALACAACFAVWSLPVIWFAAWFPLDYSRLITLCSELQQHPLRFLSPSAAGSGRYYPVYWLLFAAQSAMFGKTTWLYAFTVGCVILATCGVIAQIIHRATGRLDLALGAVPLLYLGTPVAENISTIGKAEPLICLLMFAAIAVFFLHCQTAPKNDRMAFMRFLFIGVAIVLALWTKETAIALLGFCVAGLAIALAGWLYSRREPWRACTRDYVVLLQSVIVGIIVAKLPYIVFPVTSNANQDYTHYAITPRLVLENAYFYLTQQPDVVAFGIVSTILVGIVGWRFTRQSVLEKPAVDRFLLFSAMVAMGWAYFAVLLIWRWPLGYYMLPVSYAFRAATLGIVIQAGELSGWRWPRRLFTGLVGVTALYGVMYAWYIIGSQISYSRLYTAMLNQAVICVPNGGRLLLESYPCYSEQAGGTHMWLMEMGRSDIVVGGMADYLDPAVPTPEICKLLNVSDDVLDRNRNRLPVAGDHVVVFTGTKLATWMLRGVTPYMCTTTLLAGTQGDFDLELVAEEQIPQYAAYAHVWTGFPCFDRTTLGYKLYRVQSAKPRFMWFDRYPDGWIGSTASVTVNAPAPTTALLRLSAPPFTLPNEVTIICEDDAPVVVRLTSTDEVVVPVACQCRDGSSTVHLTASHVESPRDLKINKDKRRLAVRAAFELMPTVPSQEKQ